MDDFNLSARSISHINISGFRAAVALARDPGLRGRPFVIAGSTGGRSLALDCSPEALRQGISCGMTLITAQKLVRDLTILPPDFHACNSMNTELERLVSRYTDLWENDKAGNIYLDITGSVRIFGPPPDCSSRLLRDIIGRTGIQPAAAVACNKLVSKVATRTIRPTGLIQVQNGTEAEFLAHQDIRILPGMGPSLLRTASVTGIREIGEVARLTSGEALALFGKHGPLLRNMALGIDPSRVTGKSGEKRITQQADFNEDVTDDTVIRGAIESLAEHGGLAMRRDKLGASEMELVVGYSDGIRAQGREKFRRPLVFDRDIAQAAEKLFRKIALRRIRLRSLGLSLEALSPAGFELDLFEPEAETKKRRLQEASDALQTRYGEGAVTKALVLAAMKMNLPPTRTRREEILPRTTRTEEKKINRGVTRS